MLCLSNWMHPCQIKVVFFFTLLTPNFWTVEYILDKNWIMHVWAHLSDFPHMRSGLDPYLYTFTRSMTEHSLSICVTRLASLSKTHLHSWQTPKTIWVTFTSAERSLFCPRPAWVILRVISKHKTRMSHGECLIDEISPDVVHKRSLISQYLIPEN